MDFERLENAWRSSANTPAEKAQAYLVEQLMRTLKARRRAEIFFAVNPAIALTVFTAIALSAIVEGKVAVLGEWGVFAMLAVSWAMLAAFMIARLRGGGGKGGGSPMRETLSAMLAANRAARNRCRIFWVCLPIFTAPMILSVNQLHAVGKTDDRAMLQMLLVFGLALGASMIWNTARYFWVLKPEQRRLEGLLADYEG